jgi:hypothetical protein
MKLQVNNSGAWKHMCTFSVEDVEYVKSAALELAWAAAKADSAIGLRIVDSMNTVVLHTDAEQRWRVPRWAERYEWVP